MPIPCASCLNTCNRQGACHSRQFETCSNRGRGLHVCRQFLSADLCWSPVRREATRSRCPPHVRAVESRTRYLQPASAAWPSLHEQHPRNWGRFPSPNASRPVRPFRCICFLYYLRRALQDVGTKCQDLVQARRRRGRRPRDQVPGPRRRRPTRIHIHRTRETPPSQVESGYIGPPC